jgi:hypothetical protein
MDSGLVWSAWGSTTIYRWTTRGATSEAGADEKKGGSIPYRMSGRTGEKVSCIGMGGYHLGKKKVSEAEAIKLIRIGVERGINFLDNSWDYNNGESEKRMGKAIKEGGLRGSAFWMTKNDGRTKQEFDKQLDESLQRLQTDHVDLIQFHKIIRFKIRTGFSQRAAQQRRRWRQKRPAKFDILGSLVIKTAYSSLPAAFSVHLACGAISKVAQRIRNSNSRLCVHASRLHGFEKANDRF